MYWQQQNAQYRAGFYNVLADMSAWAQGLVDAIRHKEVLKQPKKTLKKDVMGRVLNANGRPYGLTAASIETRLQKAEAEANIFLRELKNRLVIGAPALNLSWSDDRLRHWANDRAADCHKWAMWPDAEERVTALIESYGFDLPDPDIFGYRAIVEHGADIRFWRRQARKAQARLVDQISREVGQVHAHGQSYCSDVVAALKASQRYRNRKTLEGMEAINNDGDSYTLSELSDLSISNPANRHAELMVRMRGFEEFAEKFGHLGIFITLSAPSRFHPKRQIKKNYRLVRVIDNPKYDGSTPRDAQAWLCAVWARIRAKLAREKIGIYGLRVVEPHHDGCPHWHQMLFVKPENLEKVKKIFKHYALIEPEPGDQHRIKIVLIDPARGSAAGYIAKYITKNITGEHIDEDLFGNPAQASAKRILSWASAWGIRQFQQIGGPSVTVWRELRRLGDISESGEVGNACSAAHGGDWCAYCLAMGGGEEFFSRGDQLMRPASWLEVDQDTGEFLDCPVNQYGQASPGKIFGVCIQGGRYLLTRFWRWTVRRIGAAAEGVKKLAEVNPDLADLLLDLARGDGLNAGARPPWTCVNNYTQ